MKEGDLVQVNRGFKLANEGKRGVIEDIIRNSRFPVVVKINGRLNLYKEKEIISIPELEKKVDSVLR